MSSAEKAMSSALKSREERGALRKLSLLNKAVDFSSNDYLGFACSPELHKMALAAEAKLKAFNGSGGSRLLTGNSEFAEKLEKELAKKHNTEATLLFNSGYDANVGLLSSVPQKGDTIIYDELVHASIHDGIRLSRSASYPFRHNNLEHLEQRLNTVTGNIFVVVESVYSMDGDSAPLKEMAALCNKYNANFMVDEAHATGVFGMGMVQQLHLEKNVFARVHTFGKALGCHGALVAGSHTLKQYLINYARSFIYTTALPLHSLVTIKCAYELLKKNKNAIKKLQDNIGYFRMKVAKNKDWMQSESAIQSLVVPGNENVRRLALTIQAKGIDARPIMSPTVPKGKERIRICLHAYNTHAEIDKLLGIINNELK